MTWSGEALDGVKNQPARASRAGVRLGWVEGERGQAEWEGRLKRRVRVAVKERSRLDSSSMPDMAAGREGGRARWLGDRRGRRPTRRARGARGWAVGLDEGWAATGSWCVGGWRDAGSGSGRGVRRARVLGCGLAGWLRGREEGETDEGETGWAMLAKTHLLSLADPSRGRLSLRPSLSARGRLPLITVTLSRTPHTPLRSDGAPQGLARSPTQGGGPLPPGPRTSNCCSCFCPARLPRPDPRPPSARPPLLPALSNNTRPRTSRRCAAALFPLPAPSSSSPSGAACSCPGP